MQTALKIVKNSKLLIRATIQVNADFHPKPHVRHYLSQCDPVKIAHALID